MRGLFLACVLFLVSCAQGSTPPPPTRWVTDTTGSLSLAAKSSLDAYLESYQARSQHHVIVYITRTTGGEPHADWTLRAFNVFGVGRYRHDDGVVLWIFTEDDMRWITVGYGLEKALPDREASRICREIVAPDMRKGRLDRAVESGVSAIIAAIDKSEE